MLLWKGTFALLPRFKKCRGQMKASLKLFIMLFCKGTFVRVAPLSKDRGAVPSSRTPVPASLPSWMVELHSLMLVSWQKAIPTVTFYAMQLSA